MTRVRTIGAATGGLVGLLVAAALGGCSEPSAEDKAITNATHLAHEDIQQTAELVNTWLDSNDPNAGYDLTKKNLMEGGWSIHATLLQSRYSETAFVFDVTTTERGSGDNGFGGGHTERTVRMCVRMTSRIGAAPRPAPVTIANLRCPTGLPRSGYGAPIDRIVSWRK